MWSSTSVSLHVTWFVCKNALRSMSYPSWQFVLDMQFVIQMASSSDCGSRTLHSLVPDLTSRAVHAFAATGADPLRLEDGLTEQKMVDLYASLKLLLVLSARGCAEHICHG